LLAFYLLACRVPIDEEDERAGILGEESSDGAAGFNDVNVFTDEKLFSPSKEKNNAKLADLYKKANVKPDVNLVINNTFEPDGYVVGDSQQQQEEDEDDIDMDPKTLVVRKHS